MLTAVLKVIIYESSWECFYTTFYEKFKKLLKRIYSILDLAQNDHVWCSFFSKPRETTSFDAFAFKKELLLQ